MVFHYYKYFTITKKNAFGENFQNFFFQQIYISKDLTAFQNYIHGVYIQCVCV